MIITNATKLQPHILISNIRYKYSNMNLYELIHRFDIVRNTIFKYLTASGVSSLYIATGYTLTNYERKQYTTVLHEFLDYEDTILELMKTGKNIILYGIDIPLLIMRIHCPFKYYKTHINNRKLYIGIAVFSKLNEDESYDTRKQYTSDGSYESNDSTFYHTIVKNSNINITSNNISNWRVDSSNGNTLSILMQQVMSSFFNNAISPSIVEYFNDSGDLISNYKFHLESSFLTNSSPSMLSPFPVLYLNRDIEKIIYLECGDMLHTVHCDYDRNEHDNRKSCFYTSLNIEYDRDPYEPFTMHIHKCTLECLQVSIETID